MAGTWIVRGGSLQPIRRLENPTILHPDHRDSHETQELLANLHHNKFWLLCGCKKPDARMFVRQISEERYVLVNHHEHGKHDQYCPLMTVLSGESSDVCGPNASDNSSTLKQAEYRLLSPYRQIDLLALDGDVIDEESALKAAALEELGVVPAEVEKSKRPPSVSPAQKVDMLFKLLWQLMDDSFCTYRHHRQKLSIPSLQMKMRAAAFPLNLKSFGSLQQFTFVGEQGLDMLLGQLNRAHKRDPKKRHQFLFLCVISDYTLASGAASCMLLDGSALMLGQAKKPPLLLNGMQSGDGPFMLAAIYGYEKPTDEGPSVLRWALQPLASKDTLLPVASWPERLIAIEMSRSLDELDPNLTTRCQFWLHKPVLPMVDRMTGVWLQPVMSLMAKDSRGERCRVAYRLQGEGDNIEAYRRTFEHVHTLDLDSPSTLAKSCRDMFVIGKGVVDQHYQKLDKELAEHEAMEVQKKIGYRMQNRELEVRQELELSANNNDANFPQQPLLEIVPDYEEVPRQEDWEPDPLGRLHE